MLLYLLKVLSYEMQLPMQAILKISLFLHLARFILYMLLPREDILVALFLHLQLGLHVVDLLRATL